MKTFFSFLLSAAVLPAMLCSCNKADSPAPGDSGGRAGSRRELARMLASLPLGQEHFDEVYDAVSASDANGYDEEYMMADLLTSPGAGVGDDVTKASLRSASYTRPIRTLLMDYLKSGAGAPTKAGASDVQAFLDGLQESGMQIYWPYSENWDGETRPLITFDPGSAVSSNYAYVISREGDGYVVTDSVFVDEAVAKTRPVWVINDNADSGYVPLSSLLITKSAYVPEPEEWNEEDEQSRKYNLYVKDFTMIRNYDPWFAGASEFWVKCGAVNGFYAGTEAELKRYTPSVTDFIVVVKRSEVGVKKAFNAVLVTDFSDQLDQLAFLITEDDGGTITSWKCSTSVKIKSKTWGFDLEIPLHVHDDIVWRGQLGASFFTKGKEIEGRFGDVVLTFALE